MKTVLKSHKIMMVALLLITMLCISTKSFARLVIYSPEERELKVSKVEIINEKAVKKIYEGTTAKIKAVALPNTAKNKNIKWKSSNKKIATVTQDGTITAKKAGTVTITAVSEQNKYKKDSCTITVVKKINANKLDINTSTIDLVVGNDSTIKITVGPVNVTYKEVQIESSNKDIVSVSSNKVSVVNGKASFKIKAKKEGQATITVKKDLISKKCTVNVDRKGYESTYKDSKGKVFKEYRQSYYSDINLYPYWCGSIAQTGCGPSSCAIIMSAYNSSVSPATIARKNSWDGALDPMVKYFKDNGFKASRVSSPTNDQIINNLKKGYKVLVHVLDGYIGRYFYEGHYYTILDVRTIKNNNKKTYEVYVADPGPTIITMGNNSGGGNNGWYDISKLTGKAHAIFVKK